MENKFVEIQIKSSYIRRSYVKEDKKVYVFGLPKMSVFYRYEIHIQERFTSVRNREFIISVPKDFNFNLLETKNINGVWNTEKKYEIAAENLKLEYIGGKKLYG